MRRHFDAIRRPSGLPTILAIVVTLLASNAALVAQIVRDAPVGAARWSERSERIADRAQGESFEHDGAGRLALVRTSAPTITRITVPARVHDGARNGTAVAIDVAGAPARRIHAPSQLVEAREHGVSSPGQPAPASRAPPIG